MFDKIIRYRWRAGYLRHGRRLAVAAVVGLEKKNKNINKNRSRRNDTRHDICFATYRGTVLFDFRVARKPKSRPGRPRTGRARNGDRERRDDRDDGGSKRNGTHRLMSSIVFDERRTLPVVWRDGRVGYFPVRLDGRAHRYYRAAKLSQSTARSRVTIAVNRIETNAYRRRYARSQLT